MKSILIILFVIGILSVGTAYAAITPFTGPVSLPNATPLFFVDNATSISRTDVTGTTSGSFLNERGFSGIIFRTGGTGSFGTGNEISRITNSGIVMANGKSFSWGDLGISISRTDSTGTTSGNFLNERGYSGIIFRTLGTSAYGTGNEVMRITSGGNVGIGTSSPVQKLDVNGNIRLTGNIVSPNDICIGTCP